MSRAVRKTHLQLWQYPSLCRGKMLFRLLVLAQAVAILLAFSPGLSTDPWYRLGIISLCTHWITLLSIGVLCPFLPKLAKRSLSLALFVICLVLLLVTLSLSWIVWHGFPEAFGQNLVFEHFVSANLILALVVGLLAGQLVLIHAERARLIAAQSSAELDAFQARIQPHFLFNSLNALAELVHQSPADAEQALLDLADLFRAAMQAGSLLSLEQELQLVRKYLALEQWRLGEKLQIEWHLPAVLPMVKLPALTLQPLVENAVRYGIEPSKVAVVIRLEVVLSRKQIAIVLTNPLCDGISSVRQQNGLALQNIQARLELLYGERQQFSCRRLDNHFRVKLVLPVAEV